MRLFNHWWRYNIYSPAQFHAKQAQYKRKINNNNNRISTIIIKEVGIYFVILISFIWWQVYVPFKHIFNPVKKEKRKENSHRKSNRLSSIQFQGVGGCLADLFRLQNLPRRPEGEKATSATSTSHKTDISWAFLNRLLLRLENVTWHFVIFSIFFMSTFRPIAFVIYTLKSNEPDYIVGRPETKQILVCTQKGGHAIDKPSEN